MREPLRDEQGAAVLRAEFGGIVRAAGRRVVADVDDHVEDRAAGHAHELGLEVGFLPVHSAQGALAQVVRDVALHPVDLDPVFRGFTVAPGPGEESALVVDLLDLDQDGAFEPGRVEDHSNTFTSGIGTTRRPPQSRMYAVCSMISFRRFHGRMST